MNEIIAADKFFALSVLRSLNLPHDEALVAFLERLFQSAREGNLCLVSDQELSALPKLSDYVVREENRYYLKKLWHCEKEFLHYLNKLVQSAVVPLVLPLDQLSLNKEQRIAIQKALANPLTLISGGPGTGKTYLAKALIELLEKNYPSLKIAVAAPTGKATANLRTALTTKASVTTLQKLVLQGKKMGGLNFDLFLIDEGGMIDAFLFRDFFSLLPQGAKVVLLGDRQQLPPVGVGALFTDLVEYLPQATVHLKQSLRVDGKEMGALIEKIQKGLSIPLEPLPPLHELLKKIKERLFFKISTEPDFDSYKKLRILCPQRQGLYGVDYLNERLFAEQRKSERGVGWVPIIITANVPSLELYNGDFGFFSEKEPLVHFEGGRKIEKALLPSYEYGYILSVHKSQGSEFEEVLLLLPEGAALFGKEMLYTAVTRAKKRATLWGELSTYEATIGHCVRRNSGMNSLIQ